MVKAKGSLLVTADELETAYIPEKERDKAVLGFYDMKSEAERHHDRFYVLEEVYTHPFTYGEFYPSFMNMSWKEFQECKTLKGISQTTFEMMQSFCKNPVIATLGSEAEFMIKEEPQARSGYSNPTGTSVFVKDLGSWEEWHRKWNVVHQDQIDWTGVDNNWLPRPDLVHWILRRELIVNLGKEEAERIDDCDVVSVFYERVMRRKGGKIEAYASSIGGEICQCNYYRHESELSTLERQYAKSLRDIYSIINQEGKIQFISIDFLHGMFEFHNDKGDHLGEFRFDGSPNSVAETGHSLKCLEQWHKQTGR